MKTTTATMILTAALALMAMPATAQPKDGSDEPPQRSRSQREREMQKERDRSERNSDQARPGEPPTRERVQIEERRIQTDGPGRWAPENREQMRDRWLRLQQERQRFNARRYGFNRQQAIGRCQCCGRPFGQGMSGLGTGPGARGFAPGDARRLQGPPPMIRGGQERPGMGMAPGRGQGQFGRGFGPWMERNDAGAADRANPPYHWGMRPGMGAGPDRPGGPAMRDRAWDGPRFQDGPPPRRGPDSDDREGRPAPRRGD